MTKAIVIGNGGHAVSVIDILHRLNYSILGTIKKFGTKDTNICGVPTIGTDQDLEALRQSVDLAFIGIGQIKSAELRIKLHESLLRLNFRSPTLIAPGAYVSKFSSVKEWTTIHSNCFVNAEVTIGKNSIINSGTIIEHGSRVGNHTHISTAVTINGNVKIGDCCFIGSGSVIHQNVIIPNNSIINSGSVIRS